MMRSFGRDWFIDTLSLLALRTLNTEETRLRNRTWVKCTNEETKLQYHNVLSKKQLGVKRVKEAEIFREVMIGSIQVELLPLIFYCFGIILLINLIRSI